MTFHRVGIAVLVGILCGVVGLGGYAIGKTRVQSMTLSKEHQWLEQLSGDFTFDMSGVTGESQGTSKVATKLGGLWSVRHFESEVMGQPYTALEILGYDPLKKKYVGVWADSMTPLLTLAEGEFDENTKTLTMRGKSRGMDGQVGEMVNTMKLHDDGMLFSMKIEGAPIISVDYKRKK